MHNKNLKCIEKSKLRLCLHLLVLHTLGNFRVQVTDNTTIHNWLLFDYVNIYVYQRVK